jgi:hypothetical protein
MIFPCCRSCTRTTPRIVRARNALLIAASEVPTGSAMSERDMGRYISFTSLPLASELLQHLKQQCQLRDRVLVRQHKRMVLNLPQLTIQLGDYVKLQCCI